MPNVTDQCFIDRRGHGQERRSQDINYKRRAYDRRTKTFLYERTIHLGDTNLFGSVYFARYFDFQGEAREEFLKYFMGNDLPAFMAQKFGIVTVEARCQYFQPLFVYDQVVIRLQVPVIKRTKFKLSFDIQRKPKQTCAHAEQWIGFTNQLGKPIPIPSIVLENLKKHLCSSS